MMWQQTQGWLRESRIQLIVYHVSFHVKTSAPGCMGTDILMKVWALAQIQAAYLFVHRKGIMMLREDGT